MHDPDVKIFFDNAEKTYPARAGGPPVQALDKLTLGIRAGEIFSILGPTGCGKSTALNLIAGFESPTAGRVLVHGKEVNRPGPERAVVFQHASLFPWMTVLENIVLGVKSAGMPRSTYLSKARDLLNAVGLEGFEKHYPYQLSGGMQQRVGIARALIGNPEVLLMDEPFGALDYQTRLTMQQLLLTLWQEFKPTVFFITHDIGESIFISNRVAVMTRRPGRIKLVEEIDAPMNRDLDFMTSGYFSDIERRLLKAVQEENQAPAAAGKLAVHA